MPRSLIPFVSTLLGVFLSALFIVMSTAFVVIPQITGGHPGESGVRGDTGIIFHLS